MSPIEEMVSFDKEAIGRLLYKLIEELAQPTAQPDTRMKLVVDKKPDGAASPNLGDACVECCFPVRDRASDQYRSLSAPVLVSSGEACSNCGARGVRDLNMGRVQCLKCGHIGDRDEGTVDYRARGKPAERQPEASVNGTDEAAIRTVIRQNRSAPKSLPMPFFRRR
jgi:hypothetical protein